MVNYFLLLVGQFNTYTAALTLGIPAQDAAKIWMFSDAELGTLAPPATVVVNKYAPEWLLKYQSEIALLLVLLPMMTSKMAATVAYRQQQRQAARVDVQPPIAPVKSNGGEAKPEGAPK